MDKWLVIRLSAMGDIALTTGVLHWWRETRGLGFAVVTRAQWAPLFEGHPAVTRVEGLARDEIKGPAWLATARLLAREYRGWGLLDLHGSLRSRLLAAIWPGPVRRYPKFGLDRRRYLRTGSEAARQRLLRCNVPQRYALALEDVPPERGNLLPRIFLSEQELAAARRRLAPMRSPGRPLVALHPYATHADKAWPGERWPLLARALEDSGRDWFVLGRGPVIEGFRGRPRDLSNATDLRESCALLAQADVLVTGDSGPMHLAGGVGTPVLALFGPTDEAWGFFPAGPGDRVLQRELPCRPCSLHGKRPCARGGECLTAINVEHVLAALGEAAAGRKAGTSGQGGAFAASAEA